MNYAAVAAVILFVILLLVLIGCSTPHAAGCITYGDQRRDMPALTSDAVSEWVALMDTAMTRACKEG